MYSEKALLFDITILIKRGITPAYDEIGIPVFNQRCIRNNVLKFDLTRITNPEKRRIPEEKYIRQWDVLVNSTGVGTLGRVAQLKKKMGKVTVDSHVTIVRPDLFKINGKYFGYCMTLKQPVIEAMGEGATGQTELSRERLGKEIEIPIPPLSVQQKIAGILSAYDDLIENNTRRIQILEELAQRIHNEWFIHFRYPDHEKQKLIESELGIIPGGWEVKKLGEALELAYGKALKKDDRKAGVVPVFGSGGIVGYHNEALVQGPGIIVGRKGNVGSVYWSENDFFPIDTVFHVVTDLPLHYIYYNLLNQNFINTDAAVPGLNRNQAYLNDILIPNEETMDQFQEHIQAIFGQIKNLIDKNNLLRQTRDLLLPKLISGKIDVSELDIDMGGDE